MSQNIYDDNAFFEGYAQLPRSIKGLDGAPEWPAIRTQLPELPGKTVVDLGCGYGWFCRYAREAGAAEVTGIDVSEKMLETARSMTNDSGIQWQKADMTALQLPEKHYDLIYSSLALHYIDDIARLMKTLYAALKPGGVLLFSAEHPIFMAPRTPGWITTAEGNKCWPLDNYHLEGKRVTNWLAEGVIKYHRTLGTWVNTLIAAGFVITHLNEWGPTPEQIAAQPALEEEQLRPMMFILSATKDSR